MRSALNVTIGFGMVSVPVGLAKMIADDDSVEFRSLHPACSTPLKELKFCPTCEEQVGKDDVLKGFEVSKNEFVLFKPDEVEAARPVRDGIVRISKFAPAAFMPEPHMWLRHYIAIPDPTMPERYGALLGALVANDCFGVGQSVLWRKRRSCVLRAARDGASLILSTVNQAAPRIRDFSPVDADEETFSMARVLVATMTSSLEPKDLLAEDPVRVLVESRMGLKKKRPAELKAASPTQDFQAEIRASMQTKPAKKVRVKK